MPGSSRSTRELEDLISATRLRLRMHTPFFAALAMLADVRFTEAVPIAATDGRTLWFHPQVYSDLPADQRDALFLHELLHAALLHPSRRGLRALDVFNIAADIVVNGIVATEPSLRLPADAIRDEQLEHLSVDEIYELLQKQQPHDRPALPLEDLMRTGTTRPTDQSTAQLGSSDSNIGEQLAPAPHCDPDLLELEAHWKQAIQL